MNDSTLSVQLYTVREQLARDLDGTLGRLAAMGLRQVEPFNITNRTVELADALARHGLIARTGHAALLSTEVRVGESVVSLPSQQEVFEAARVLGMKTVIDPFVAPDRWLDAEQVSATAAQLNAAAELAAGYGLRVGYHNHTQEFAASFDGLSALEFFADQLRSDVALEIDLYWAATARQDVPALLARLGDRVIALHMKDGIIGPDPFVGDTGPFDAANLDQRPAGQGEVPLLEYLAAAPATVIPVIEFDHYDGDIFAGIEASVSYLRENGVE